MLNSPPLRDRDDADDREIGAIVRAGPKGAIALAGVATVIVLACWLAFYLFVFLPRS
ncbi:hypothetical protein NK718_01225 [Alsobacter sp. SYSU M60028]|uniref:Cytochrome c oxidase subunit 2A n=1 Tax=Alsobacter ponti TaxID=2962936 RepID=A0ABT1LA62_9HYPH|nr:hypothetical protein [Alsobacter ponti]MCP8937128.1 hypothetical protein [Alsobacter ponti]